MVSVGMTKKWRTFCYYRFMTDGVADLGDLSRAGVSRIELACGTCERRGAYGVPRLLQRYGASCRMTDLKDLIAEDCPRQRAADIYNRCGVLYVNSQEWLPIILNPRAYAEKRQ
jgi:hypothetical protein